MPPDPTRTALIAKLSELVAGWRYEAKARGYPEIFTAFGQCADELEAAALLAGEGLTQEKEKDQELGLLGTAAGADSTEPAPRRKD